MKITKGMPGYIQNQKKKRILTTVLLFGISFAIFLAGYLTTHTRNNLLTIVAILGCLPAARSAVGMIMLLPYRSLEAEKVTEVEQAAAGTLSAYDMVLTSSEKVMPVEALLISRNLICGYASRTKVPLKETEQYIVRILKENHYDKVTVKIFPDYSSFLKRAESMGEKKQKSETQPDRAAEEMRRLILTAAV
nr:hypothetical protein [uncultured Sellimonas sp.]